MDGSDENGALLRALQAPELAHLRDVTVYAGTDSFLAHRVVLASSSRILSAKLACTTRELHIPNVTASTWQTVQDYMYSGRYVNINDTNEIDAIARVLECAQQLEMEGLIIAVELVLMSRLGVTNCCTMLEIGHRHDLHRLKEAAIAQLRDRRGRFKPQVEHDITNSVLTFLLLILMLTIFFGIPQILRMQANERKVNKH